LQQYGNCDYLKSLSIPYIIVGRWLPGLEDHSVISDEYEKTKEATLYFIKMAIEILFTLLALLV